MNALVHQFGQMIAMGVFTWCFLLAVSADVDPVSGGSPRADHPENNRPRSFLPQVAQPRVSPVPASVSGPHSSWQEQAREWLGDAALADEVARYNACDSADPIPERPLANPAAARRSCEIDLGRAADAVAESEAVDARRFAPQAFDAAERALAQARAARGDARYSVAASLASWCVELANQATRDAREAAIVALTLEIHSVEGAARHAKRHAQEATPLAAGTALASGGSLFTEASSRTQIGLPGLGQITLADEGELSLVRSQQDLRKRHVLTEWRLDKGRLTGQVVPSSEETQLCEIVLGGIRVSMERAAFELSRQGDEVTVRVFDGEAKVRSDARTDTVTGGFVWMGREGVKPQLFAIPGPVTVLHPLPGARIPGGLSVRFGWAPLEGVARYQVRLFQGRDTVVPFRRETVGGNQWSGSGLAAGEYVVSVVAELGNGMAGDEGAAVGFWVLPQLAVEVVTGDPHTVESSGIVIAPRGTRMAVVRGDLGGDVAQIEWRLDGGAFQSWDQPVAMTLSGTHRFGARGLSADGSKGREQVTEVWIDAEGPVIKHAVLAPVVFPNQGRRVPVAVAAADRSGGVSMRWRRPGGTWQVVKDYFSVPEGAAVTVEVEAVDRWGNRSLLPIMIQGP